jgi:hypothetical protein
MFPYFFLCKHLTSIFPGIKDILFFNALLPSNSFALLKDNDI